MNLYRHITTHGLSCDPPVDGVRSVLICSETNKSVEFWFAGNHLSLERIASHMDSLTDDQCDFWLNPERIKKKQEEERKVAAAERAERARLQAIAVEKAKAEKAALKAKQKDRRK